MQKLGYWSMVLLLSVLTLGAFRFTLIHGWTAAGMYGLFATLVLFAVLLAFALSMKDRRERSRPIPR